MENIFYNIAQTDFEGDQWPQCLVGINSMLGDQEEMKRMVGLRALRELVRAFHLEDKKINEKLAETFLPNLQKLMELESGNSGGSNQI